MACRSHFNSGARDRLAAQIQATAPRIAAVIDGIRTPRPRARIVVVGYPDVLRRTGNGCYPLVPLSPGDVLLRRADRAGGQAGTKALAIGSSTYGRRPALYRLSATPSDGERKGATRTVHFRVKR